MKKTLSILAILLIPLILTFFSGCGPTAQEKLEREALSKYPSLTEWKNMRARLIEEGTQVRWRLYVLYAYSDELICRLEGLWGYDVVCWTRIAPASVDTVAKGDWVQVTGRFLKVDKEGRVKITVEELKNLGP